MKQYSISVAWVAPLGGLGGGVEAKFVLEYGHVAYQIKGN